MNSKIWEDLREWCNYSLEDIRETLDYLEEKYREEKEYEDNKEEYIQDEIDDRIYNEKRLETLEREENK